MGRARRYVRWRSLWVEGSGAVLRWLCASCVLLFCARAEALDLAWSAPAGCPGAAEIRQRVAALLARQGRADRGGAASGQIERESSGEYRLTLKLSMAGEDMARVVRSPDCRTASETAAWLLAMAGDQPEPPPVAPIATPKPRVKPEVVSSGDASSASTVESPTLVTADAPPSRDAPAEPAGIPLGEPRTQPEPLPERAPARDPEVEPRERVSPSRTLRRPYQPGPRWGRVALFTGLWGSGLPAPASQLGLRAGLGRGLFYGELRASFVLPREAREGEAGKVRVYTQQLGLSGCALWGDRLRFGPCLQLTGQHSVGSTTVGVNRRRSDIFWLTAGPAAALGVRLYGAVELSFEAGLGVPLTSRPRFSVAGRGPLTSASFVSGHLQIGLGVRWQ